MLGKLLKHEFHATGRIMLPALAALVLLAGMANLSYRGVDYVDNAVLNIILNFIIVVFFLGLFAAGIIAVVIMVQRFYKNLLGEEGYLMFTLPVNVHGLVWSKLIVSTVWITITWLVCIGLLTMTVFNFASLGFDELLRSLPSLRETLQAFYTHTDITPWDMAGYIAELIVYAVLSSFSGCLMFYAAMAIGHCFSKNKVLLSIVAFIAISFILQILFASFGVATGSVLDTVDFTNANAVHVMHGVFLYFCLTSLAQAAILYLLTVIPLKKGLNLA